MKDGCSRQRMIYNQHHAYSFTSKNISREHFDEEKSGALSFLIQRENLSKSKNTFHKSNLIDH